MTTNTGRSSGSFTKEALLIDGWDFNEQKYARVRRASEEGRPRSLRPAAQARPAQPSPATQGRRQQATRLKSVEDKVE